MVSDKIKRRVDELLRLSEEADDPTLSAFLSAKALETYVKYFIRRISGEPSSNNLKSLWYELSMNIYSYGFRGYMDKLESVAFEKSELLDLLDKVLRDTDLDLDEEDVEEVINFAKKTIKTLRRMEEEIWPG